MSGDPEQEFFADGIAKDIITELSGYPSLFVIAQFVVQDEITEAVTISIAPVIGDAEQLRAMRKPPGSFDAWAAYQRGLWHLGKVNAENNARAAKFFQQAVDLDPSFSGGYKGLAVVQSNAADFQGLQALRSAEALARRAVALDDADAEACSLLSSALRRRGDHEGALTEAERALTISPNLAAAHAVRGATLIFSGATEGRRHGSRNKRQARPSPIGSPFEPDRVGTIFPAGIRGRDRGCEPLNPVTSRLSQHSPLARRRARPARSD
jgi:hypothetical protein